jgi:WD40 repeat protein
VKLCDLSKEKDLKFYEFAKEFTYHEGFILAVHKHIGKNGFYSASKDMKIMHVDS